MENVIINEMTFLPPKLMRLLPKKVKEALEGMGDIEELRLSARGYAFVRKQGKNLSLPICMEKKELEDLVLDMCGGSFYAHTDSISLGFISLGEGLRVGLSGRAVTEGGKVMGIRDVESICIRIPHAVTTDVSEAVCLLKRFDFTRGLLVYAPPAGGKTTYLRNVALALSSGASPRRVVVVDSRDELSFSLGAPTLCIDILKGYPVGYGIEVATRTLGAEVIICDEIGSEADARAILAVQSGGVPLVASAHASDVQGLMGRQTILGLHRAGVFGAYLGLCRGRAPSVCLAEEIDACF
jgi:stage III sporulation protein AA